MLIKHISKSVSFTNCYIYFPKRFIFHLGI